ncbi:ribonuclease H-like protein [Mycena pura]|uniref:3'-5' exonuclease n=1 Tax=Mycena pura TaxID=153505 RepID=A0AAD6YJR7_9AGAR|nr:ribonuclease H-like protein [Mycena pura]
MPAKHSLAPALPLKITRSLPLPAPSPTATTPFLPVYTYKSVSPAPTARFIRNQTDADIWVQKLDRTGPLSVDFEWVASFRKGGNTRPVSLVQLADKNTILLIQLRNANTTMSRFPRALQRLLEDPIIPKAGANILSDAKKLFRDYGIMMAGAVELGALARQADPACAISTVFGGGKKLVSLAKLVERYLHKSLCKDADMRLGNWEDPNLEEKSAMLEYAANDVYCGYQIYDRLLALAKSADITLDTEKYTGRVFHAKLAPPAPERAPSPSSAPTSHVPRLDLSPEMVAAGVGAQHLRAYRHWAMAGRSIDAMCVDLRVDGKNGALKRSTVITYVISALQRWPRPPLTYDLAALRLLVQEDLRSWEWHYEWLAKQAGLEK